MSSHPSYPPVGRFRQSALYRPQGASRKILPPETRAAKRRFRGCHESEMKPLYPVSGRAAADHGGTGGGGVTFPGTFRLPRPSGGRSAKLSAGAGMYCAAQPDLRSDGMGLVAFAGKCIPHRVPRGMDGAGLHPEFSNRVCPMDLSSIRALFRPVHTWLPIFQLSAESDAAREESFTKKDNAPRQRGVGYRHSLDLMCGVDWRSLETETTVADKSVAIAHGGCRASGPWHVRDPNRAGPALSA